MERNGNKDGEKRGGARCEELWTTEHSQSQLVLLQLILVTCISAVLSTIINYSLRHFLRSLKWFISIILDTQESDIGRIKV
jgi:hypothetical protein